ncbi:hypothetical protein F9B74_02535 [Pelistega sp. NLN82]|uniref:Uncharacterized protein n=1 Tax=Pelistega ratti TaxID=2652177 RepID=A0A6L9Y4S8_9BURK|nr:hypothetical protein [Pelistega ratti]NEN75205.1 hypothetical protein [Pelistega ratti]
MPILIIFLLLWGKVLMANTLITSATDTDRYGQKHYISVHNGDMQNIGYNPSDTATLLRQQGEQLLQQLSLSHTVLWQENTVFGLPTAVWLFDEKSGFDRLLRFFEKGKHPFTQINILPQQLYLQADMKNAQAILWIKRHHQQAYSGSLSLFSNRKMKPIMMPLLWLPDQAVVLLDIEQQKPEVIHQWIYTLPFSVEEANHFMQEQLQQHQWEQVISSDSPLSTWQKSQEQLMYYIVQVNDTTSLYLVKKRISTNH